MSPIKATISRPHRIPEKVLKFNYAKTLMSKTTVTSREALTRRELDKAQTAWNYTKSVDKYGRGNNNIRKPILRSPKVTTKGLRTHLPGRSINKGGHTINTVRSVVAKP